MKVRNGRNGTLSATALKVASAVLIVTAFTGSNMAGAAPLTPAQQMAQTNADLRAQRYARHTARLEADRMAKQARWLRHLAKVAKAGLPSGLHKAVASMYGPSDWGSGLAGGGTLKSNAMIVAHKSLPFGTMVQFFYHGRTVTVPVKDRGPYISGREFDLGPGTARALGFDGVAVVQYRIVKR